MADNRSSTICSAAITCRIKNKTWTRDCEKHANLHLEPQVKNILFTTVRIKIGILNKSSEILLYWNLAISMDWFNVAYTWKTFFITLHRPGFKSETTIKLCCMSFISTLNKIFGKAYETHIKLQGPFTIIPQLVFLVTSIIATNWNYPVALMKVFHIEYKQYLSKI